jgi:Integrase zinc binding domain
MEFIVISNQLWCKNPQGQHKMVVPSDQHLFLIASAHNDMGHHRVYATNALLSECYWWPNMSTDIKWYIQTCHICQIRNTQQLLIPPVVAMPAPSSPKSTWTQCICQHQPDIGTSLKNAAFSCLGQNGLCYRRKPEKA